jgi:hypothetical protein
VPLALRLDGLCQFEAVLGERQLEPGHNTPAHPPTRMCCSKVKVDNQLNMQWGLTFLFFDRQLVPVLGQPAGGMPP